MEGKWTTHKFNKKCQHEKYRKNPVGEEMRMVSLAQIPLVISDPWEALLWVKEPGQRRTRLLGGILEYFISAKWLDQADVERLEPSAKIPAKDRTRKDRELYRHETRSVAAGINKPGGGYQGRERSIKDQYEPTAAGLRCHLEMFAKENKFGFHLDSSASGSYLGPFRRPVG